MASSLDIIAEVLLSSVTWDDWQFGLASGLGPPSWGLELSLAPTPLCPVIF